MPRPDRNLPLEFSIFPLPGALLLPHGRLPLNIFEPRYLALVEDAMASGRMFGIVQPDRGKPAGPTGPGLYKIGCLGRVTTFSETEDGRFLITLTGLARFRVAVELELHRGYRRVRGDFTAFPDDLAPPEPLVLDRAALVGALRRYFTRRGLDANWSAIDEMDDEALVTTLCMVCPFDPAEKQALMESPTPDERAAALLALLRIDAHGPADGSDPPPRAS